MAADRILYIEPSSGISGDMMLGALLDLGAGLDHLKEQLSLLSLQGYKLEEKKCLRAGIRATKFDVVIDRQVEESSHNHTHGSSHSHRSFRNIREIIDSSQLSQWVKEKSLEAFHRLAEAEGKIHGQPAEAVQFHEVGAIDSIVDIVGCMIAVEQFLPVRILSAPVNVGQGTLECRHGIYPAPGPAAQELLKGIPIFSNAVQGELTTPTGATLLATLVREFRPRPLMKVERSGYGAGMRETQGNANVLRVTLGESDLADQVSPDEQVAVIDATIDDMNPQIYGYFQEKALAAGALDVYLAAIQMKKNRPGVKLTVVCAVGQVDALARLIFRETTTIGIRYNLAQRKTLQRQFHSVQTEYGTVTVKVATLDGQRMNVVPEYEDCRRVAAEKGVALKEVLASATRAFLGDSRVDPSGNS
ncbi:MAG TPA: nickel pincer cofactor biosynthesis protein LarC [Acidobacteriota bacterium]|nr:nickel pincer cofactor biosynthesis protein LarC [Acidobacteriota bacterium]